MTASIPVWTWRDAIRKSKAPALTKHVCNCIANYLSDVGEGCYPGVKALMNDSSLSNRSVATHIETAKKFGLLKIVREVGKDGRFKRTFYFPRFPDNTSLPREPASHGPNHVNDIHANRPDEPASPGPRERRGKNRVKEVHGNNPIGTIQDRSLKFEEVNRRPQPARLDRFVSEAALDKVRHIAPGWDRQFLLRKFTDWGGSHKAKNIDAAFLGWVRAFTKGSAAA